jgi:hypothetical protein
MMIWVVMETKDSSVLIRTLELILTYVTYSFSVNTSVEIPSTLTQCFLFEKRGKLKIACQWVSDGLCK